MASKFNQREKDYIRNKLIQEGKELFGAFGLKKTSISDLTNRVGIAQGTFYLFFASKEALYFEILEQEERYIRDELINGILLKGQLTKDKFITFLQQTVQLLDKNSLLRQLFDQTTMNQLLCKLPLESLENNNQGDIDFLLPYIKKWQEDGIMKQLPPEVIVSMIRSLIILSFQKDMIGESNYKPTMDQFIHFISDGLIKE